MDGLTNLFPLVHTNNIEMFAGINASGKTSVLKVILFAMDLLSSVPINQSRFKDILGKSKKVVFDYYVRYYNEKTREWKEGAYAKYTYEPKNIVNN
jgi:AAA15 family ATPase/GTPase